MSAEQPGIAKDVNDSNFGPNGTRPQGGWLWKLWMAIIGNGIGANAHYVTTGDGKTVPGNGAIHAILPEVERVLPRISITNNGAGTIDIGYNGNPTYPVLAGMTYTLTWKNPRLARLCFSDLGTAATVDVIS